MCVGNMAGKRRMRFIAVVGRPTSMGLVRHISAGAEEVLDRHLAADAFGRKSGLCSVPTIGVEEFFKIGDEPRDVLEHFFEEVFDKCGLTRPLRAAVP
jgi:hypothetical protein